MTNEIINSVVFYIINHIDINEFKFKSDDTRVEMLLDKICDTDLMLFQDESYSPVIPSDIPKNWDTLQAMYDEGFISHFEQYNIHELCSHLGLYIALHFINEILERILSKMTIDERFTVKEN